MLTRLSVGILAAFAIGSALNAEVYPSKPITIVVPYAAGGATDTIGRVMAERMKSSLGQPVIVEDVTGAGGTIAVGRVARAAPDGFFRVTGSPRKRSAPFKRPRSRNGGRSSRRRTSRGNNEPGHQHFRGGTS